MPIREENYEMKYHIAYAEELLEAIADSVVPLEKKKECPICGAKFNVFLPFGVRIRKNAECPHCHSLERHRALWLLLEERRLFAGGGMVLHFAPERVFYDKFSYLEGIDYWPVDINPKMYGVRKAVDITNITFEDNSIDMIICNHVLEHIPNEKKALSELYRVLSPNGVAFLNVPIMREQTLENPAYNTPELRFKYYGQDDHVRAYGKDYPERLKMAGFRVEMLEIRNEIRPEEIARYGLIENEIIYLCRK